MATRSPIRFSWRVSNSVMTCWETFAHVLNNVCEKVLIWNHWYRTGLFFKSSTSFHFVRAASISYFERTMQSCSDGMPDSRQLHLPILHKRHLYSGFMTYFMRLHDNDSSSQKYFVRMCCNHCGGIEIMKNFWMDSHLDTEDMKPC